MPRQVSVASIPLQRPPMFVGRDAELERLAEAFERVPVAVLCGVAGVGKSALAAAFASTWPGPVLRSEILGGSLAELVDDARRSLGPAGAPVVGPVEARLRALAEPLETAAGLWVIDDLHHLAPGERRLLFRVLGGRLIAGRVLATSRERVGAAAGGPDHAELRLDGLAEADARRLWQLLDELYGAASGFDAILARSGGSPFLLRRGHAGDLSDEDPVGDSVAGLAICERWVAGAVALAAIRLPAALIDALAPPGTGRAVLRRLVDTLMIEVDAGGGVSMHDLVRDAVLRRLTPDEQRRIHAELARLLAEETGLDPARRARAVCRHLCALDRHEEAARYLIEQGSELDKYGAAGELLRGLEAIPRERRTAEASAALARASARAFDLAGAFAEHERLLAAAGGRRPDLGLIHALLALVTGRPEAAERALRDAVPAEPGPPAGDRPGRPGALAIRALTIRALLAAFAGQPGQAAELLRPLAERVGAAAAAAPLWLYSAFVLWIEGRDAEAYEAIRRALVLRAESGALSYRSNVLASTVHAIVSVSLGRFAESAAALEDAERLMAGDEDLLLTSYVRQGRGYSLVERGEWGAALTELAVEIERLRHGGHVLSELMACTWEARALLAMGRRRDGLRLLDETRAAATRHGLAGIARVADRARACDPVLIVGRPAGGEAGQRPSQSVWNRLGEAIRAGAAGEASRVAMLLAAEAPAGERPDHELGRVLASIARAALALSAGDTAEARAQLAAAGARAAAAALDDDLVPAIASALGALRVVTARGGRIAAEAPPLAAGEVCLDLRTHELRFAGRCVSFARRPLLRRLLYRLAGRRGAIASKDELADALWSREFNPLTDHGSLKSNVANLRKLIEPAGLSIEFDDVGYRLTGTESLVVLEPFSWPLA